MHLRLLLGSLLLLAVSTTAQNPTPAPAPAPAPAPTPPAPAPPQDRDKPQPTPAEQLAELAKEKARLEKEIQYVQERAKNSKAMLANKLRSPVQGYRSIDAGVSQTAAPAPPPPPRYARLATGDEMASLPQDVMLTVNSRPVSRQLFDKVLAHLKANPNPEDEGQRVQRVLYDLIVTEAMSAIFAETEAEGILGDVLTELEKGKSMQDLAKAIGSVQGSKEGRIEVTRNSPLGPRFEQIAFETKPGTRARFRNAFGIVVLAVETYEKGASPDLDKVVGMAIQIPYSSDVATTARHQQSINMAQIDIVVRDAEVMAMLPQLWKQPAVQPAPIASELAGLRDALGRLQAEIEKLSSSTEATAKERLEALKAQYAQIKDAIKRAELSGIQAADDGTEKPKKVEPAPKKEEAAPKKN